MKGVAMIIMLLGLLVGAYLVVQDLKAKREHGTANIEAIERASQVGKKMHKAGEAQERRVRDIVGE
jgi:hypothetical protein